MGSAAVLLAGMLLGSLPGAAWAAAAEHAQADPAAISGVYECHGIGANGRPYHGAVIIEPDGDRFLLRWVIGAELSAIGVGIQEGDVLAVSFYGADAGGVIVYRIDGERLLGQWSAPLTRGQTFEETLTRVATPTTPAPPSPPRPPVSWRPIAW